VNPAGMDVETSTWTGDDFKIGQTHINSLLRFVLPIVLAGCLLLNTIWAQTFQQTQPVKENQNRHSAENRWVNQRPSVLREDHK
jgi:hypothetical protein